MTVKKEDLMPGPPMSPGEYEKQMDMLMNSLVFKPKLSPEEEKKYLELLADDSNLTAKEKVTLFEDDYNLLQIHEHDGRIYLEFDRSIRRVGFNVEQARMLMRQLQAKIDAIDLKNKPVSPRKVCPFCKDPSVKVWSGGTMVTLLTNHTFHQDGKYHNHDNNKRTTECHCDNGHHWSVEWYSKCPACDYQLDKEEKVEEI